MDAIRIFLGMPRISLRKMMMMESNLKARINLISILRRSLVMAGGEIISGLMEVMVKEMAKEMAKVKARLAEDLPDRKMTGQENQKRKSK